MGSMLSGMMGGGSSPGQQAQMHGLQATQQDLQAYRPEAMQARLNLLSNASAPYQGMNNALETLWGVPPSTALGMGQLRGMGPPPQRMFGHDMPLQAQHVSSSPSRVGQQSDPVSQAIDPLDLLGSW